MTAREKEIYEQGVRRGQQITYARLTDLLNGFAPRVSPLETEWYKIEEKILHLKEKAWMYDDLNK